MKENKGFSLIELIAVIAIMAIIAGIAIPVYNSYIDKANKSVDEQLLKNIEQVLTYALMSDFDGELANGGYVTVGKDGVVNDPDKTTPAFYNILAQAGLAGEGLKFDGWNSDAESQSGEASPVEFSMFTDENGQVDEEKITSFFECIQSLSNTYADVSGKNGNSLIVDVSKALEGIDQEAFADEWCLEDFMNEPRWYSGFGFDEATQIYLYYVNAKAVVSYVENNSSINNSEVALNFRYAFYDMVNTLNTISGEGIEKASAISEEIYMVVGQMFIKVEESLESGEDERQAFGQAVKAYLGGEQRREDAKAFLATLNAAVQCDAEGFDAESEDAFMSESLCYFVRNYISDVKNNLQDSGDNTFASAKGEVGIILSKNDDGTISVVLDK